MLSLSLLVLAVCGTAIATPVVAPRAPIPQQSLVMKATAADQPNCTAIYDRCHCTDDDLSCEEAPDCEWCWEYGGWN
ncbi:mitochondrial inner membrane protein required for protein import [Hypoxylon texense]